MFGRRLLCTFLYYFCEGILDYSHLFRHLHSLAVPYKGDAGHINAYGRAHWGLPVCVGEVGVDPNDFVPWCLGFLLNNPTTGTTFQIQPSSPL